MLMLASTYEWLWRNAVGIVPLVLVVAVVCRLVPMKASTRHAMWLVVLLALLVPPFGPAVNLKSLAADSNESSQALKEPPLQSDFDRPLELDVAAGVSDQLHENDSPENPLTLSGSAPGASSPQIQRNESRDKRSDAKPAADSLPADFMKLAQSSRTPAVPDAMTSAGLLELVEAPAIPIEGNNPESLASSESECAATSDVLCVDTHDPSASEAKDLEERCVVASDQSSELIAEISESDERPAASSNSIRVAQREEPGAFAAMVESSRAYVSAVAVKLIAVRNAVMGIPPLPAAIWIAGSVALMSIMGLNLWRFRILMRGGDPGDRNVESLVRDVKRRIGLSIPVDVLMVKHKITPMIWCGRRVRLLLPVGLWDQLDEAGKRGVIVHELAHLARRDHWVCWLSTTLSVIYWWHPLVWLCHRRLREEADLSCDTWVTAVLPRARKAYAQALLATRRYISETNIPVPRIGLGVTTPRARRFARRLTMVMTNTSNRPRLSVLGVAASMMLATAAWLATPLWACPPEERNGDNANEAPEAQVITVTPGDARIRVIAPTPPAAPTPPGGWNVQPPAPAVPDTTYEQYMHDRSQGSSMGAMGNLDERMNALERRMDELSAQLDRLLGAGGASGNAAAPSAPRVELERRNELMRQYSVAAGELKRAQDEVRSQQGQLRQRFAVAAPRAAAQAGEMYWKTYRLSDGKLDALVELMRRDDVPVLIRAADDGIEVQATEVQHEVFGAFVKLIDPDQSSSSEWNRSVEMDAVKAGKEAAKKMKDSMKRRSVSVGSGAAFGGSNVTSLRAKVKMLEAQAKELQMRADALERQADSLSDQADNMDDADAQESLERQAEQLLAQSETLTAQAEQLEDQADTLSDQADELEDAMEQADESAESMETTVAPMTATVSVPAVAADSSNIAVTGTTTVSGSRSR